MQVASERSISPHARTGLILGIESSCDETAAAVVRGGHEVMSNIVASQMEMHALYGGVVPELASREHLRNIVPVVREALRQAYVLPQELDAVAVTAGPGLAGALLVGMSFAKAYAFGLGKPLIAVNHLEGHIHAVLMEVGRGAGNADPFASLRDDKLRELRDDNFASLWDDKLRELHDDKLVEPWDDNRGRGITQPPLLALVVSGGHTHLYLARELDGVWDYQNAGRTVDDAAGEAYDKVAKLLGLGYPGGPWIDRLSVYGNPLTVPFRFAGINRGTDEQPSFDFSFSGIKTAVLRYVETHGMKPAIEARRNVLTRLTEPTLEQVRTLCDVQTLDLIASFQHAVVGNLIRQTLAAAAHYGIKRMVVSGGVAANRALRARFAEEAVTRGLSVHFPAAALSTDNAAMIAAAAWPKLLHGDFADASLNAAPQLRLG